MKLFSKIRYLSDVLNLHFINKTEGIATNKTALALLMELCSPLTSLFNSFPGFVTTGLSKAVSYIEARASQGKQQ